MREGRRENNNIGVMFPSQQKIQLRRIQQLNDRGIRDGNYVLYWMQQSQRAEYNHALEFAVQEANRLKKPLLVVFGLTNQYPNANLRHYCFMLEGLQETKAALSKRGIRLVAQFGQPPEVALKAAKNAALIVCDRGYLRHQVDWRRAVASEVACRVIQVESDIIVPVEVVSDKAEYAARTFRPKIAKHLPDYLVGLRPTPLLNPSLSVKAAGLKIEYLPGILKQLDIDGGVPPVSNIYRGGTSQAKKRFGAFLRNRLLRYRQNSNQPQTDDSSQMSPYLHFGQVSPLYLAVEIEKAVGHPDENKAAFLEELIVRRELAVNHVRYCPNYDTYKGLPGWAQKTLRDHGADKRPHTYSATQLENAETHDNYWNAAMREMRYTGFMHNYMRMYWGKKILEWSPSPQQAFLTALNLNNKYFLDGRDPNSYAGVAWVFGLHDRAWPQRPIFGKIRYMAASGLERKCDIGSYIAKVEKTVLKIQA